MSAREDATREAVAEIVELWLGPRHPGRHVQLQERVAVLEQLWLGTDRMQEFLDRGTNRFHLGKARKHG